MKGNPCVDCLVISEILKDVAGLHDAIKKIQGWKNITEYVVIYDANGGSNSPT